MDRFYTEDQKALRDTARRFAQAEILPRAAAIDRDDRFDRSLYKGMADLGLFGICLREGAGGAGSTRSRPASRWRNSRAARARSPTLSPFRSRRRCFSTSTAPRRTRR